MTRARLLGTARILAARPERAPPDEDATSRRLGNINGILGPAGTGGPTRGHATDDRLLAVEVDEPLKGQGVSGHVPGQVLDRLRVVPGPRGTCSLLRTRTVRPEKRKCPLVPFYRALRNNLSR